MSSVTKPFSKSAHMLASADEMASPAFQVLISQAAPASGSPTILDNVKVVNRRRVLIWNAAAAHAFLKVYFANTPASTVAADLTAANGFPIPGGFTTPPLELLISDQLDIWAIAAAGGAAADVRIWQEAWA